MLPYAVITTTGTSGSSSFAARRIAESVAHGQLEIGQNDDRPGLAKLANRFGLIARLEHGMAVRLERVPEHRPERVFVFDDEDGQGRH